MYICVYAYIHIHTCVYMYILFGGTTCLMLLVYRGLICRIRLFVAPRTIGIYNMFRRFRRTHASDK